MTSRELVKATIEFKNTNGRAPRDLWTLDWASIHYPNELAAIRQKYPNDYAGLPVEYKEHSKVEKGHPTEVGQYIDPWGSIFTNVQRGVIGVPQPLPLLPLEPPRGRQSRGSRQWVRRADGARGGKARREGGVCDPAPLHRVRGAAPQQGRLRQPYGCGKA